MSYEIMAFDPAAAPDADEAMAAWYREQTAAWQRDDTAAELAAYDDPSIAAACLQAFYRDIIKAFPPMVCNGVTVVAMVSGL